MLWALSAVYTLLILGIVWVSSVYCPLLLMRGAGAVKAVGVKEGRSRFTVLGIGAKVQNS